MPAHDFSRERIESNAPVELKRRRQWVAFQLLQRAGDKKPRKVPIDPTTGQLAEPNDMATWGTFDEALAAVTRWNFAGVGYVFSSADPYSGIDLDDVIVTNPDDSESVATWANQFLELVKAAAYVETSPSGTGVHAIFKGKLPAGHKNKVSYPDGTAAEAYESARFFTFTGARRFSPPNALPDATPLLRDLCERLQLLRPTTEDGQRPDSSSFQDEWSNGFSDDEVIERARNAKNGTKFASLFDRGDVRAYDVDDSKADMALVALIAFWTGPDRDQIDRIFRRSKLYREKWDRDDYRKRTIDAALDDKEPEDYYRRSAAAEPQPTKGKRRSRLFLTEADYLSRPEPGWLIEGVLPDRAFAAIVGDPGSYKSFQALDMALSVALGRPWQGHGVKQGTAAYVMGEGGTAAQRRVRAFHAHHGTGGAPRFFILPEPVGLSAKDETDAVIDALKALPSPIRIVVLDTLARTFGPGDENRAEDMGRYVEAAGRIQSEFDSAVLVVHHNNKQGEYRGSSAFLAALETMIGVTKDGDCVRVRCERQKDDDPFADIRLAKKTVWFGDGPMPDDDEVLKASRRSSLVFVRQDADGGGDGKPGVKLDPRMRNALLVLRDSVSGWLSQGEWRSLTQLAAATFSRLAEGMVRAGYAELDDRGRGRPKYYRLTEDGKAVLEPHRNPFERAGEDK